MYLASAECQNALVNLPDKKIHYPGVIKLWKDLVKSGDIYKKNVKAVLALAELLNIPADITAESLNNFQPSDY